MPAGLSLIGARVSAGSPGTRRLSAPALTATVAGAALAVAALLHWPGLGLPLETPMGGAALESAAILVAALLAYLALWRFRQSGLMRDVALVNGLLILAFTNLALGLIPAMLGLDTPWRDSFALGSLGAAIAAVHFAIAASGSPQVVPPTRRIWLDVLRWGLFAGVLVLVAAIVVLAQIVGMRTGAAVEVVAAAAFGLASVGFTREARHDDRPLLRMLGPAAAIAAVGRVSYAITPDFGVELVSAGDLLKISFYAVLGLGAMREIAAYGEQMGRAARTEERRRIARDLHDGLAQELVYISMTAEGLIDPPGEPERARQLRSAAERALDESRRAIAALATGEDEPLETTLARTAEELSRRLSTRVDLRVDPGLPITGERREDLLRIVREAVTNAARHGHARDVSVELTNGDCVTLRVADDGLGFDPEAVQPGGSFGLTSMRERAVRLGADFDLRSVSGEGTVVEVRMQ